MSSESKIEVALWDALIQGRTDAIIATDTDGYIQVWNPGAERIYGWSRAEAVGKTLDLIVPEEHRRAHWNGYRMAIKRGRIRYDDAALLDAPALTKRGERIHVQWTATVLLDDEQNVIGLSAVMRDVTKPKVGG